MFTNKICNFKNEKSSELRSSVISRVLEAHKTLSTSRSTKHVEFISEWSKTYILADRKFPTSTNSTTRSWISSVISLLELNTWLVFLGTISMEWAMGAYLVDRKQRWRSWNMKRQLTAGKHGRQSPSPSWKSCDNDRGLRCGCQSIGVTTTNLKDVKTGQNYCGPLMLFPGVTITL